MKNGENMPADDFAQAMLLREAAAFRQAYQFTVRGEKALRDAGYTSVSHYIRETRIQLERERQNWERKNPAL